MDNWKINLNINDKRFPFIVVDNWYNENEQKAVWTELEFYNSLPPKHRYRAEEGPVAKTLSGAPKSSAYRFYLDDIYTDKGKIYSPILNTAYKTVDKKLDKYIVQTPPYNRQHFSTNRIYSLISYYEENDHYRAHYDSAYWTVLIWFCKDKDLWTGGDLYFPESNNLVKTKHNRCVMFPSPILHAVTPVKFKEPPKQSGLGRYTITHFLNYSEEDGSPYLPIDRPE
jgi:hypothetical protein